GHDVHVVSVSRDDSRHEYWDDAVRVLRIPGPDRQMELHTPAAYWIAYSTLVARALQDLGRRVQFDIIDFPEWASEGFVHLLNRTTWSSIPAVVQLHGPLVMFGHAIGWPELNSEFYRTGTFMEATCL